MSKISNSKPALWLRIAQFSIVRLILLGGDLFLMMLGIYRIDGLNSWLFMLPAVAMALSSGVFEELLYRGVLFRIVEESFGTWISLVVSSFVFSFRLSFVSKNINCYAASLI